jgi:hypothetical protein
MRVNRKTTVGTRFWVLAALAAASLARGAAAQDSAQTNSTTAPAPQDSMQKKPVPAVPAVKTAPGVNAAAATKPVTAGKSTAAQKSAAAARPRYRPDRFAGRAGTYYRTVWGVDSLGVKTVESGEVIRFTYRVLDPDKAKILNDERIEPSLNDPRAGVSLVVPSLEKVGKLRQSQPPEEGKSYWMAFSNKGRLVKRGDHINIVIGQFHADGLVVD